MTASFGNKQGGLDSFLDTLFSKMTGTATNRDWSAQQRIAQLEQQLRELQIENSTLKARLNQIGAAQPPRPPQAPPPPQARPHPQPQQAAPAHPQQAPTQQRQAPPPPPAPPSVLEQSYERMSQMADKHDPHADERPLDYDWHSSAIFSSLESSLFDDPRDRR